MFPKIRFLGIDLNADFINRAEKRTQKERVKNVRFEKIYLRDLLARPERFDAVLFISVLHEFYTYGEGISSVLKALADAHELLQPGGEIIVRDMILHEYVKSTNFQVEAIARKVSRDPQWRPAIHDFEKRFGRLKTLYGLNHFLLKYMYTDNWERECLEHYVPVTFEQYEQIFTLLGMELQLKDSYLIPYLYEKWRADFGLTDDELAALKSTGVLVAKKKIRRA